MASLPLNHDQPFPSLLDATMGDVRSALNPVAIVHEWSYAMLDAGDWTRGERQQLWDMRRACREMAIRRSPLALLFSDFAPRVSVPSVALWGPMRFKNGIFAAGSFDVMPEHDAHHAEERANHDGNLAQHRRHERKTRSTAVDLADTMHAQSLSSELLAMSAMARS